MGGEPETVTRVKCEHTLVCIVIDGHNVSTPSQCRRNVSTVLTIRYVWSAHIMVNSVAMRNNQTALDNILINDHQ